MTPPPEMTAKAVMDNTVFEGRWRVYKNKMNRISVVPPKLFVRAEL